MALDFTTATLDARVTIARALNTATRVNSSGYIEGVNANLPRFDFSPTSVGSCLGLLIEEARTNIILQSADLATTWTVLTAAVQADQTTAPDNTLSADKIVPDSAAALGASGLTQTVTAAAGTYTFSCFAKIGEFNRVRLLVRDNAVAGNNASVTVSLVDGAITTAAAAAGTFTGASATVRPWALGFYRITLTMTTTGAISLRARILVDDSVATVGDGVKGIYAWGAQLEAGAFATSYIPTTTTSLTRNADVVSMTGTNFSDWFNASEGTFSIRADLLDAGSLAKNPFGQVYGTATTTLFMGKRVAGGSAIDFQFFVRDTTTQAFITPLSALLASNTFYTGVSAYKTNSFQAACNAIAGTPDTSGTVPTGLTVFNIGSSGTETAYLNGHVSQVSYWPQRITNAEVQAFSKR
jgi:hypothetical protein